MNFKWTILVNSWRDHKILLEILNCSGNDSHAFRDIVVPIPIEIRVF